QSGECPDALSSPALCIAGLFPAAWRPARPAPDPRGPLHHRGLAAAVCSTLRRRASNRCDPASKAPARPASCPGPPVPTPHRAAKRYTSLRMLSACTWTCPLPRCNQSSIRPEAELPLKPAHTKQADNVVVTIRLPALWAVVIARDGQGLLYVFLLLRQ